LDNTRTYNPDKYRRKAIFPLKISLVDNLFPVMAELYIVCISAYDRTLNIQGVSKRALQL
jgi:hypothetical protein